MGSKGCKAAGTGEASTIIKQGERGATSGMSYAQKCTQAWETNSNDCSSACGYRTTTSFQLLSCGGTNHTSRLLQWVDTSSSGKTGQEEEK